MGRFLNGKENYSVRFIFSQPDTLADRFIGKDENPECFLGVIQNSGPVIPGRTWRGIKKEEPEMLQADGSCAPPPLPTQPWFHRVLYPGVSFPLGLS